MIRAVRLNNFIKFEDDLLLKFDTDGVSFFMGENNSGKSIAFEAVRRCLAMKFNCTFKMNFPNEDNGTYVVCEFELPEEAKEKFNYHSRLLTSFVHIPTCGYAKVVVLTDYENKIEDGKIENKDVKNPNEDVRNQNGEAYMDIIIMRRDLEQASNFECQIDKEDENIIIGNLKECTSSKSKEPKEFLRRIEEIIKRNTEQASNLASKSTNSTKAAGYLEALCEHVIFTFGFRALGRVQWSNSRNLTEGTLNYKKAGERSEIIKWFREKKQDGIYDVEEADKIFKTLTGGEMFVFDYEENILLVKDEWGHKTSVLKVREGILEARHIALLLSCKSFKTLLLEEPDRGMHPQMIHRLSSLILPRVEDKVILIISHNAAFLSPTFIPRTFKFCKEREQSTRNKTKTSLRYHIVNVGDVIQRMGEKMPRLLSTETYANVIFAKRVLFVEGESDYMFTRALVSHILYSGKQDYTRPVFHLVSELHKSLHGKCFSTKDFENLECLLTSLHIMMLNGHKNKDKWHDFCEGTMIPHIFLLDADAVMEKMKEKGTQRKLNDVKGEEKERKNTKSAGEQEVSRKLADDKWEQIETMNSEEEKEEKKKQDEEKQKENASLRECAKVIYDGVQPLLQKAGMKESKDKKYTAKIITNCLTKTFLQKGITQPVNDKFSGKEEKNMAQEIVKVARESQNQVDMKKNLSEIDTRLYGKMYKEAVKRLRIPEYRSIGIDTAGLELSESNIVPENAKSTFLKSGWMHARNELLENNVFAWKDGSIEDAFLEIILTPEAFNIDNQNQEERENKKENIFRRYLAFHSLNMCLRPDSFQKRKDKNNKLYISSDTTDDDVKESIDRVLSFCSKDSDIIVLVHFLTEYANKQSDHQAQT